MRFALHMKGGINSMKRTQYLYATVLTASILFMCSCNSPNSKDDVESSISNVQNPCTCSSCVSYIYNEKYDTDIIGVFSKENYSEDIEHWCGILKQSSTDEELNQHITPINANFGTLDDADSVKYAAIKVFDKYYDDSDASPSSIKVFYDEQANAWLAERIENWMLDRDDGVFNVGGTHYVIFSGDGNVLATWQEQ